MPTETRTAAQLEAQILAGLRAQGVDAASIEVYPLDEPGVDMSWTVRRLRLNRASKIKAEGALKRVVFALAEQFELAREDAASGTSAAKAEEGA